MIAFRIDRDLRRIVYTFESLGQRRVLGERRHLSRLFVIAERAHLRAHLIHHIRVLSARMKGHMTRSGPRRDGSERRIVGLE